MLTASITLHRKPKDGTDGVTYEIQLDTDSVVLDSATKQFVTHKLGDVHFIYHQGSYTEDMTSRIINTYSYIILYYGYEGGVYKAISYSSDEGVTDIWNTMQMNVGDDADCYSMKYIWYDKNLPDNDEAMFEKIWSKLDGVPPTELGIKILATKMFTVSRNGDSVKSSDVVFGIGTKTQQPTAWITNFGGLTLAEGKYVWTCTKTTLTNGITYYTGAYCLGECYDFAQVEELYALSGSSTNPPEDAVFSSSYKVVNGKYLWSCVKVTYNDANISFLNKECVSYFPNDGVNGTKFTPKGTAFGHYTASSKMPKPSDDVLGLLYLVDKVDTLLTPINTPCVVWWRSFSDSSYMLSHDAAEEGDAYNVDGTLWVHNGTVWKDFGSIQGPKGDDGQDALNIDLSTDRLIFDYNSPNFNPSSGSVAIVARHGNTVIDPSEYSVKIISTKNYDAKKASISTSGKSYNLIFKADGITMITYSPPQAIEESNNIEYPASSCNVKLAISYNGITYTKTIFMDVSFAQTYGDLKWNTERLYGEFGEFKTDVAGKFTQTASAISAKADAATLSNFKNEYDENGKVVNKRIGEIEVKYNQINIRVENIDKGLKDTGFDITNNKILATANHFEVRNNKGVPTFTIDVNGNLTSSGGASFNGKITATSGNIGGLEIYNDSYQFGGQTFNYKGLMYQDMEYDGYMPNHSVNLNDRYVYVGYGDSGFGGVFYAGNKQNLIMSAGEQSELLFDAFLVAESHTDNSVTGQSSMAERLVASCNASGNATALEADAYGGKENYAVDALRGDVRAQEGDFRATNGDFIAESGAFVGVHRGNVTKIYNSDYTLKKTDSTIICINKNKGITINLPSDAEPGTFYRIIKRGKTVTFKSDTMNISFVSYGDVVSSVSSVKEREWINCFWDGEYWYVEMSGN